MVERPLSMREVPGSIPGFSMDMARALVLLKPTCLLCFFWILFLLSLYWVVFPYLFTVTVTFMGRELLLSRTKSLYSRDHDIDYGVLLYYYYFYYSYYGAFAVVIILKMLLQCCNSLLWPCK